MAPGDAHPYLALFYLDLFLENIFAIPFMLK